MSEIKHTALPWQVVSDPHFDNGLVYTSVQPVNVDEEAMKPLAMANGEFHVCRMSHTAAPWRFNYHRANAAFIVEACNSYYGNQAELAKLREENERLREAMNQIAEMANWQIGVPTDTEAANEHARIAHTMAETARASALAKAEARAESLPLSTEGEEGR